MRKKVANIPEKVHSNETSPTATSDNLDKALATPSTHSSPAFNDNRRESSAITKGKKDVGFSGVTSTVVSPAFLTPSISKGGAATIVPSTGTGGKLFDDAKVKPVAASSVTVVHDAGGASRFSTNIRGLLRQEEALKDAEEEASDDSANDSDESW